MGITKTIISCALIFNLLSVQGFDKIGEPETEQILRKDDEAMEVMKPLKNKYGVFDLKTISTTRLLEIQRRKDNEFKPIFSEEFAAEKGKIAENGITAARPTDWERDYIAVGKILVTNNGYGGKRSVKINGEDFWNGLSIAIEVRIYDQNDEDYNKADGMLFFKDLMRICKFIDYEGIPLEAMLAQAYTEGGAGKKGVYTMSNNLFGIRAGANWRGYVYARNLRKTFVNYETAIAAGGKDLFRAYSNMAQSVQDYVNLIRNSELYKGALGKSAKKYLKYITKRGYGDESMVSVWLNVIKIYKLKGE